MENWAKDTIAMIDSKLEGTKEKNIRFFRIDEFKRNIIRTDKFSASCPECQKQIINITAASEKINEAIHVPGPTRREYDRLISRMSTHMQKKHGFYAPYYYTYLFSFFGMVAGLLLGYFLYKLFPDFSWEMLSVGFATGLITGYVWGHIKDQKIRSEKRLM